MTFEKRWQIVKELGAGGQGTVSLVRDKKSCDMAVVKQTLEDAIRVLPSTQPSDQREKAFHKFLAALNQIAAANSPESLGALKQLHSAGNGRDPERAGERIARELQGMREVRDPHLLRVIDSDGGKWFVSEYHSGGTLIDNLHTFKGDVAGSLAAIRPMSCLAIFGQSSG